MLPLANNKFEVFPLSIIIFIISVFEILFQKSKKKKTF